MTYDNFTIKAQEAIMRAQQIAGKLDQQSVDTPHLIKGIIEIDEDVSGFLLQKVGANMPQLNRVLDEEIAKYPKVTGGDKQYLSNDSNRALDAAKKMLKQFGDEYISLELILLAILKGTDTGARILTKCRWYL